jgi:uncharacterized protein YndB with AHSA1/START domain
MTTTETDTAVTTQMYRVYIAASPEEIWEAITSPEWNGRYGYHMPGTLDLQPGGAYRVAASPEMVEHMGLPEVILEGEVLECEPPFKLVQTWHPHFSPEQSAEPATTLTYEIHPETDKLTRLTLTHDTTGAPEVLSMITGAGGAIAEGGGGWAWVLSDLKTLLERGSSLEL